MQLEMQVAPKGVQQEIFNRLARYKADIASLRHQLVSQSHDTYCELKLERLLKCMESKDQC